MPMLIAPERLTLAFSKRTTRSVGSASLALIAAIGPPVPPPMTRTSVSMISVLRALALMPASHHASEADTLARQRNSALIRLPQPDCAPLAAPYAPLRSRDRGGRPTGRSHGRARPRMRDGRRNRPSALGA